MSEVKTIFQGGVFKPTRPINLEENTEVVIEIEEKIDKTNSLLSEKNLAKNWESLEDEEAFKFLEDDNELNNILIK